MKILNDKKSGSQTPFSSELRSAQVKESFISRESESSPASGNGTGTIAFNIQRP